MFTNTLYAGKYGTWPISRSLTLHRSLLLFISRKGSSTFSALQKKWEVAKKPQPFGILRTHFRWEYGKVGVGIDMDSPCNHLRSVWIVQQNVWCSLYHPFDPLMNTCCIIHLKMFLGPKAPYMWKIACQWEGWDGSILQRLQLYIFKESLLYEYLNKQLPVCILWGGIGHFKQKCFGFFKYSCSHTSIIMALQWLKCFSYDCVCTYLCEWKLHEYTGSCWMNRFWDMRAELGALIWYGCIFT